MADLFWTSFAALIVVAGPWKAAIVFGERTLRFPVSARQRTAILTVVIATVLSIVFLFVGDILVELFHIEGAAFLIGAGLIMVVFAIRMVLDESGGHVQGDDVEVDEDAGPMQLAAYPLAMPLVVTPVAIVTLTAIGVQVGLEGDRLLAALAALALVMLINLLVFLFEASFEDAVHPAIWQISGRVLGVLLAAFGISVIADGLRELGVL